MTFNFNSPLTFEGKTVSILGHGNTYKTTIAIRLALQKVSYLTGPDPNFLTIFDVSSVISEQALYKIAGFSTSEDFEDFKKAHNLSISIIEKPIFSTDDDVVKLLGQVIKYGRVGEGKHYIIVDDVCEIWYSRKDVEANLRYSIRDFARELNGIIYVIGQVSKVLRFPIDRGNDDARSMWKVWDKHTHYDASTILLTHPVAGPPRVFIAKSDEGEAGRTLELRDGAPHELTPESHPELVEAGLISSGVGIERMYIPPKFVGILSTFSLSPDSSEFVSPMYLPSDYQLSQDYDGDTLSGDSPLNFGGMVWIPHVHKTIGFKMRYPSFINARNKRKSRKEKS